MDPDIPEENPAIAQDSQHKTDESIWTNTTYRYNQKSFLLKSAKKIIFYPRDYSKILMQLGYEPKAPVPSVTLLRRPCLLLPNILTYMKYIKEVDGWTGCYRGMVPYLLRHAVSTLVCSTTCELLNKYWVLKIAPKTALVGGGGDPADAEYDQHQQQCKEEREIQEDFITCIKAIVKDWCCLIAGIVVSYPLRVIAIQTMAEFVGRDKILRKGIVAAAAYIYKEGGILAFYSGIIPKIIGGTVHMFTLGCLSHFLRTTVVTNKEGRNCIMQAINILLGVIISPFQVVSLTMAVNGSGLALGREPFMPNYRNWLECWSHLAGLNQLRRGSSLFIRHYTGPTHAFSNGMRVAYGVHFGPDYSTSSAIA